MKETKSSLKTYLNSTEVEENMIAKQEVDVVHIKNEEMLESETVERVKQKIEDKNENELIPVPRDLKQTMLNT